MLKSEAIRKSCIVRFHHIQNFLMSSYWFILIKFNYIYSILCFRSTISWINTIKSRLILIFLILQISWSWHALFVRPPHLIAIIFLPVWATPAAANIFPMTLAPNVPNNLLRNPPFCFSDSFSIASQLFNAFH